MKLARIAVASVSTTVGATRANTDAVLARAREAAEADAWLAAFPEQVIGGYPAEDLVQWRGFVTAQRRALDRLADATRDVPTILVVGAVLQAGGELFNAAVVLHRGVILGAAPKEKLPTYDIFYEARTLARGTPGQALVADGIPLGDYIFGFGDRRVAVEVCEDAWAPDGPMRRRAFAGADVVVNVSASPFRVGIESTRREMLSTRSADNQALLIYANAVGGQDGLVFDGGGYVLQGGRLLLDAPRFVEGLATCVVDLDRTLRLRAENTTWRFECETFRRTAPAVPVVASQGATATASGLAYPAPAGGSFFLPSATAAPPPRKAVLDDLYEALGLGLRDYFAKSGAFARLGVALSGGRDSLLSLLVAWRAAQRHAGAPAGARGPGSGADLLSVFYMPSRHSGADTRAAAETICRELGVALTVSPIDEAYDREAAATRDMLGGEAPSAIALQNIQARIRGQRMWNWANSSGALFVQTSDMSEKAVGYTTIGGDLEGALSVIANVPKTVVIALLERLTARFDLDGVRQCLATAPGPELADAQTAEAELMPFPVLDACLYLFASEKLTPAEVAAALPAVVPGLAPEAADAHARRFARLFARSIYKWVQSPLALHVGTLDLDRERALQLPVVQRPEWWDPDA
jgi:NAD+ synthase (glutamine-hydrolysing)